MTRQSKEAQLRRLVRDPLLFVRGAFPWGEGRLAGETGPDQWQAAVLTMIRDRLQASSQACQVAVASGHGPGKTALIAWLILWFVNTRPHCQVVVTANTKQQLDTKTWRELAKWHKLYRLHDRWAWTATRFYHVEHPETWYAAAIPWSKDRPEAFAGTHEKHVAVFFDEASRIEDPIWETTEGVMTTERALWIAFGNPTRNTGRFKELFPGGRFAHRWTTYNVDSRTAKKANQGQIQQWIDDYGEDSDFVRVRVKGIFPRASSMQFISEDLIESAQRRFRDGLPDVAIFPKILGVDVARYGDDQTVLLVRKGPVIQRLQAFRELDTMQVAALVAEWISTEKPQAVFVDMVGIGAGVVDRLHQLGHDDLVMGVNAGSRASKPQRYANKRAEMWDDMRLWLKDVGCLDPAERDLAAELMAPEYGYDAGQRIQLEKKEDMKGRGLASPDLGDALSMTWAFPVALLPPVDAPDEDDEERLYIGRRASAAWMG